MRILHVLAQLPSKTGSGVYFNNVIKGLKDKYEQACVFGFQDDFYYDNISIEFQYAVEFKTEQMPFNIVGMSDEMPYDHTRYCDLTDEMQDIWVETFTRTLKMAMDEFNPDIIICHHLWMLTSLVINIAEDKKIVGICHGTDIRQCEKNPHLKEKYLKNINKLDLVFALSDNQVLDIEKTYKIPSTKIINVGGGFDENIFYPGKNKKTGDRIKIVYAGKLSVAKGVYEMIDALAKIDSVRDDIEISIIGARDDQIKEFNQILSEFKDAKLHGVIPQVELANIFRESDIFIIPSYFEGLGLVAIEALACGMRVVSSRIDGLINTLGDEIIDTGVIQIVELPKLFSVDIPDPKEIPHYIENLKGAIETQIENVLENRNVDSSIIDKIYIHSWENIIKEIDKEINRSTEV